jgi:hypothetical protein
MSAVDRNAATRERRHTRTSPLLLLAIAAGTALLASGASSCGARPPEVVAPIGTPAVAARASIAQDSAPKEEPRLVPAEAWLRTYLQLFGGLAPTTPLAPLDAQTRLRGADGAQVFDEWTTYASAIGLPDYRFDLPRGTQTNATMLATFERLGEALCARAVEHDLQSPKGGASPASPPPVAARVIFAFELPAAGTALDRASFAPRFDVVHRTFLGYPASLAPTDRTGRFLGLYQDVVARHAAKDAPRSRFTPEQAGWAAVCEGLVRHPEFQLY